MFQHLQQLRAQSIAAFGGTVQVQRSARAHMSKLGDAVLAVQESRPHASARGTPAPPSPHGSAAVLAGNGKYAQVARQLLSAHEARLLEVQDPQSAARSARSARRGPTPQAVSAPLSPKREEFAVEDDDGERQAPEALPSAPQVREAEEVSKEKDEEEKEEQEEDEVTQLVEDESWVPEEEETILMKVEEKEQEKLNVEDEEEEKEEEEAEAETETEKEKQEDVQKEKEEEAEAKAEEKNAKQGEVQEEEAEEAESKTEEENEKQGEVQKEEAEEAESTMEEENEEQGEVQEEEAETKVQVESTRLPQEEVQVVELPGFLGGPGRRPPQVQEAAVRPPPSPSSSSSSSHFSARSVGEAEADECLREVLVAALMEMSWR